MIFFTSKPLSATTVLVEVSGRFTEAEREYFFDCISEMIDKGIEFVVVDCFKLGHLSSEELAELLAAKKRASKNGGRIYLTGLNSRMASLIETTKLGRVLSVYATNEDAISSLRSDPACVG